MNIRAPRDRLERRHTETVEFFKESGAEYPIVLRFASGSWWRRMGDSFEIDYYSADLESEYQRRWGDGRKG